MKVFTQLAARLALLALVVSMPRMAHAEERTVPSSSAHIPLDLRLQLREGTLPPEGPPPPWKRPLAPARRTHVLVCLGAYAALGGPAPWGPTLAVEVLPGGPFSRWGVRGEWRAYDDYRKKSLLLGALFEAASARPKLALKLALEGGVSDNGSPIVGAGIQWSYWLWGPVGVSTYSDMQLRFDGAVPKPGLAFNIAIHLGR